VSIYTFIYTCDAFLMTRAHCRQWQSSARSSRGRHSLNRGFFLAGRQRRLSRQVAGFAEDPPTLITCPRKNTQSHGRLKSEVPLSQAGRKPSRGVATMPKRDLYRIHEAYEILSDPDRRRSYDVEIFPVADLSQRSRCARRLRSRFWTTS
jgi:hypothetical protein